MYLIVNDFDKVIIKKKEIKVNVQKIGKCMCV